MDWAELFFDILDFVLDLFSPNWPKRLWIFVTKGIPEFFSDLRKGLVWARWKVRPVEDMVLHTLVLLGLLLCEVFCVLFMIKGWASVIAAIVGLLLPLAIIYFMIPPTESEDQ